MDSKWAVTVWEKVADLMDQYNEPGKFTAFVAFEWTSNGEVGQNLHRNVIYRESGARTRHILPLTTFESAAPGRAGTDPESLWAWLDERESKDGLNVLTIPHNGNMSNGWMFSDTRYDGSPLTPEWAAQRARWEVLYEIFQNKGSGETHPGLSPRDEFSAFEIWDTGDLAGNTKPEGAIEHEYLRQALKTGLQLQGSLGTNPYKYGMVGGTDTHTGLPSGGEEDNFWGKFPAGEPSAGRWDEVYKNEESYVRKDWTLGAAGLTGVWAAENTREAIWDAMRRRETYASSGPRMVLRFFGGFGFSGKERGEAMVKAGYAQGVPMGADLPAAPAGKAPSFLFTAMKDPEGANLDRVQVIKGWLDEKGQTHEKIFDVALSDERKPAANGKVPALKSTVNVAEASYSNSIGAAALSGVFTDPEFDPKQAAFYYARVIEIPTPRWTAFDAARFGATMDAEVPMVLQERAVSSPIWYTP
jgi:hypothetical protein